MEASLYIHVPFCLNSSDASGGKCDYCDFYSIPARKNDPRLELYVKALIRDGENLFEKYKPSAVPSLYIGGGTPSALGAGGIKRLLKGVLETIRCYAPAPREVTVEANPESAGEEFLAACREAGATRLSLGIQTFYAPSRKSVHRAGEALLIPERLRLAAEYFPNSFSVDIISGFPFQEENALLDDIDRAVSYAPAHISFYALTLEDGTPLAARRANAFLPERDEADRLWISGRSALEKAGYSQYEVSNFCLKDKESLHNKRYWLMRNWLALGPAASSTIIDDEKGTGFRYTVPPDVDTWLESGGMFSPDARAELITEKLDPVTLVKETIMMGFRYIGGPDEILFKKRFGFDISDIIPKTLAAWREKGFLLPGKNALTKSGFLFLDPFLMEAFEELDGSGIPC